MKRSNIIILSAVALTISWLLISGWMQANAYKIIKSGKSCSYAGIMGWDNAKMLQSFKNIKVDADKIVITPSLIIKYGEKCELSFSNSMKNAVSSSISDDTLYLKIKRKTYGMSGNINISVPSLNSLNILTSHDTTLTFRCSGVNASISDFNGKNLSITNIGQNNLMLNNNKLNKLVLKGNFYKGRKIEFLEYTDCDSLDINVEGQHGTLVLGSGYFRSKENPKQWISIKVPGSFRIEAEASVASKIILKK